MRRHAFIIAALLCAGYPASAGEVLVPSEPVVRGSIRGDFAYGSQCLTAPLTEYMPGVTLEMRPCRNSADQIFEWNVISFEIKIHKLCVGVLRAGDGHAQPGDPIGLWYCQGTPRQQWFSVRANPYSPTVSIVGAGGPVSDLCLEFLKDSTVAGTQVVMAACDDGGNQQFRMQPWPPLPDKVSTGPVGQVRLFSLD